MNSYLIHSQCDLLFHGIYIQARPIDSQYCIFYRNRGIERFWKKIGLKYTNSLTFPWLLAQNKKKSLFSRPCGNPAGALNLNYQIYFQGGFNQVCMNILHFLFDLCVLTTCYIKTVIDSMIQEWCMHEDQYGSKETTFWNEMLCLKSSILNGPTIEFEYQVGNVTLYTQVLFNI